jgi:hypothetical protein
VKGCLHQGSDLWGSFLQLHWHEHSSNPHPPVVMGGQLLTVLLFGFGFRAPASAVSPGCGVAGAQRLQYVMTKTTTKKTESTALLEGNRLQGPSVVSWYNQEPLRVDEVKECRGGRNMVITRANSCK